VPHRPAPGTPEEWIVRAKSNLALAKQPKQEDILWEEYCFQAHQAVEKALKAVYQRRGLLFKYVHDIEQLAKGLEQGGVKVPTEVRLAVVLNPFAHEARYPGPLDPATEKEYEKAVTLAAAVVEWADKIVKAPDEPRGTLLKESPVGWRPATRGAPKRKVRKPRSQRGRS